MNGLAQLVEEAGVVGQGGAGFPAHVKYSRPAKLLVINGAECEPLLRTDQYIIAHFARRLSDAAFAVKETIGAEKIIFALKGHYREQVEALKKALAGSPGAEICLLESVYPTGDEQVLLYEAAGLTVQPGGIPLDSGAVVSNAGTLLAVADALEGKPLTHKYLTVAGKVKNPSVLHVPIGISFAECIAMAGGAETDNPFVLAGGPIMGRAAGASRLDDEVVTKTCSGIIVLDSGSYLEHRRLIRPEHMKNRAHAACIQCSMCSDLCPRKLLGSPLRPHLIMRAFGSSETMDELVENQAAQYATLCCECGICEIYSCPMELQPCRINILIKEELRQRNIRPVFPPAEDVDPFWSSRRVPSERMAARAGLFQFYHTETNRFAEAENPSKVFIPLKMHAGPPSIPCVGEGSRVKTGDLIADIAPGSLGAKIHASIDGIARLAENGIVIEAEGHVQ
jgi:Na+-translocating ferredoxin:NAD+ oxidoreductase RnfC subunit